MQRVWAAALVLAACGNPDEPSDLRPDGPPDVLAVVVNSLDHRTGFEGQAIENATFCRLDDPKRPGVVGTVDTTTIQVCPDDLSMGAMEVTDAVPGTAPNVQGAEANGWYARIVFDELLDPSVEDLIDNGDGTSFGTIQKTLPVTLTCNKVPVAYDGYYSPSGNSETYPLGPSLVVFATDPTVVPTGATCELAIKPNAIHDKQGETVPADELGPFTFAIDTIQLESTSPAMADPPVLIEPTAPIVLTFNAPADPASLDEGEIILQEGTDCATPTSKRPPKVLSDPDSPTSLDIIDNGAVLPLHLEPSRTYILTFVPNADVQDIAGGKGPLPDGFSLCFQTDSVTL